MIDPYDIVDYHRDTTALQEFYLFTLAAAGKNARQQAAKLNTLLAERGTMPPFEYLRAIRRKGMLARTLKKFRLGQYHRLTAAFAASLDLNLRTVSVEELEQIPGVGPKTARFFILYTRENAEVAVLDTHLLAHLREQGFPAPRETPKSASEYDLLERIVLLMAKAEGMTPTAFDAHVWQQRSRRRLLSLVA